MPEALCITADVERATFLPEENRYVFPRIDVPKIEVYTDETGEVNARGFSKFEAFQYLYLQHHLKRKQGRRAGTQIPTPFFLRQMNFIYENCERYESVIWACPRGWGKSITNFFAVLYFAIAEKKFNEILLIGANQALAETWLNKIKTEIASNELLIAEYGELCSEKDSDGKWANDEIKLRNGIRIFAKGAAADMRGMHPGLIILDDIENDKGAKSPIIIEEMEEWIRSTVINMQNEEDSVVLWTGTFLQRNTVLQNAFMGEGLWDDSWFRIKHDGRFSEESKTWQEANSTWCPYEVGKSIWPERYDEAWLQKRLRKIGIAAFMAEIMNDPKANSKLLVPKHYIRYYEIEELPKIMNTFLIIDPAASQKEINCESSIVVLGTDAGQKPVPDIFVLDAESGHWDEPNLVRRAIAYAIKWKSRYIGVEVVNFSVLLKNTLEIEMIQQRLMISVEAKEPKSKDKVTRLRSIVVLMERGQVKFLKEQKTLIDQLTNFPRKGILKDQVDAFVYGLMDLVHHWQEVDDANFRAKKKDRGEPETANAYAIEEISY